MFIYTIPEHCELTPRSASNYSQDSLTFAQYCERKVLRKNLATLLAQDAAEEDWAELTIQLDNEEEFVGVMYLDDSDDE